MKPKSDWEKELRSLFEAQRQLSFGLARIGGDYSEPEEQAVALLHQAKQEGIEEVIKEAIRIINDLCDKHEELLSELKKKGFK